MFTGTQITAESEQTMYVLPQQYQQTAGASILKSSLQGLCLRYKRVKGFSVMDTSSYSTPGTSRAIGYQSYHETANIFISFSIIRDKIKVRLQLS